MWALAPEGYTFPRSCAKFEDRRAPSAFRRFVPAPGHEPAHPQTYPYFCHPERRRSARDGKSKDPHSLRPFIAAPRSSPKDPSAGCLWITQKLNGPSLKPYFGQHGPGPIHEKASFRNSAFLSRVRNLARTIGDPRFASTPRLKPYFDTLSLLEAICYPDISPVPR